MRYPRFVALGAFVAGLLACWQVMVPFEPPVPYAKGIFPIAIMADGPRIWLATESYDESESFDESTVTLYALDATGARAAASWPVRAWGGELRALPAGFARAATGEAPELWALPLDFEAPKVLHLRAGATAQAIPLPAGTDAHGWVDDAPTLAVDRRSDGLTVLHYAQSRVFPWPTEGSLARIVVKGATATVEQTGVVWNACSGETCRWAQLAGDLLVFFAQNVTEAEPRYVRSIKLTASAANVAQVAACDDFAANRSGVVVPGVRVSWASDAMTGPAVEPLGATADDLLQREMFEDGSQGYVGCPLRFNEPYLYYSSWRSLALLDLSTGEATPVAASWGGYPSISGRQNQLPPDALKGFLFRSVADGTRGWVVAASVLLDTDTERTCREGAGMKCAVMRFATRVYRVSVEGQAERVAELR